ncbi:MAG: spore coat protein [Clostridiales bacterium]|nr:spore coat protein [Clostridiales bacterium]
MADLTQKELSALEEQLNYEKILIVKYHAMATQCSDPQLKTSLEQIAAKHQGHYEKLFSYLN